MKFISRHWFLILLVAGAFILRIGIAYPLNYQTEMRFYRPDTPGYLNPAVSLAVNGTYSGSVRPPGFPVLAAGVLALGGNAASIALLMIVLSTATLPLVYACGAEYDSRQSGLLAALLFGLNLTSIANAPMMLSDTCFTLIVALQLWMFLRYRNSGNILWCIFGVIAAGIGTLIRPINLIWICPAIVLVATASKPLLNRRLLAIPLVIMGFLLIIMPWMWRNATIGAGWCIDTNTGAMHHQNGAMILAAAKGSSYEIEKQRIITRNDQAFADIKRFPDERSKEKYRIEQFKAIIFSHPWIWFKQHFSWHILLPDAPTFLEVCGITKSGRGTLEVLKTQGIISGAVHYFNGHYLALLLLMPLMLIVFFTYMGAAIEFCRACLEIKRYYWDILLFFSFVEYYFFLPGPITVPRYQLPALPLLCVMAGSMGLRIYNYWSCRRWKKKKSI